MPRRLESLRATLAALRRDSVDLWRDWKSGCWSTPERPPSLMGMLLLRDVPPFMGVCRREFGQFLENVRTDVREGARRFKGRPDEQESISMWRLMLFQPRLVFRALIMLRNEQRAIRRERVQRFWATLRESRVWVNAKMTSATEQGQQLARRGQSKMAEIHGATDGLRSVEDAARTLGGKRDEKIKEAMDMAAATSPLIDVFLEAYEAGKKDGSAMAQSFFEQGLPESQQVLELMDKAQRGEARALLNDKMAKAGVTEEGLRDMLDKGKSAAGQTSTAGVGQVLEKKGVEGLVKQARSMVGDTTSKLGGLVERVRKRG